MGGLWGTTVAPIVPTGIISHRLFINLLVCLFKYKKMNFNKNYTANTVYFLSKMSELFHYGNESGCSP